MTTAVAGGVRSGGRPRRGTRWAAAALLVVAVAVTWLSVHLAMPGWYARIWYPLEHVEAITVAAQANRLPADLIAGVIYRESRFTEDARSDQGAVGLMQVLPETAAWIHEQPGAPAAEPERLAEPAVNIAYGAWYLRYLLGRYGTQELALVAYNGGETNLRGWIDAARAAGRPFRIADVPFPETRRFVRAVAEARAGYRRAWSGRLGLPG